MRYIEAPTEYSIRDLTGNLSIFLAGGITGCPDWQKEMVSGLEDLNNIVVFNPRRSNFDSSDQNQARRQIEWEFRSLHVASFISFWFPKESICPIALYELGRWVGSSRFSTALFIGMDREYPRRRDVEIQVELQRRDLASRIVYSLPELVSQVKAVLTCPSKDTKV